MCKLKIVLCNNSCDGEKKDGETMTGSRRKPRQMRINISYKIAIYNNVIEFL